MPPGYTENSCDFFVVAICEAAQLYVRQYVFDVRSSAIWTRRSYDDSGVIHWQDWKQIVLATPPQEFSLPLTAGIDAYGKSTYWKTQEGICFVNIAAHSSSDGIMDQSIIATLPAGFRPDMVTYAAGHGFTNAGTRIPLDVQVNPDGTIQIWGTSVLEYCSCFVGFVAAS